VDKHRGLVIGLKREWDIFFDGGGLRDVHYVRNRVVLEHELGARTRAESDCSDQMIFNKNEEWPMNMNCANSSLSVGYGSVFSMMEEKVIFYLSHLK